MQFLVNQREFVPIDESKYNGLLTPRAYQEYDCQTKPQARHLEESLVNSFPVLEDRVEFLNKFYQCLLADKMPHKARKMLCSGGKDSGKTTWASILKGLWVYILIFAYHYPLMCV